MLSRVPWVFPKITELEMGSPAFGGIQCKVQEILVAGIRRWSSLVDCDLSLVGSELTLGGVRSELQNS